MKCNYRKAKKQGLRALAALLTLAMLMLALPLTALAEEEQPIQTEVGSGDEVTSGGVESGDELPAFELGDPGEMEVPVDEPLEPENETELSGDEIIIVGFEDQDKGEFRLAQKPTTEMVCENLPGSVLAYIDGLDDPVEIPVEWRCDDYDDQDYGTFVFTARFAGETVNVGGVDIPAEDIVFKKGVVLPQVRVEVVYITGFEPLEKDSFAMEIKPESVSAAVEAMELPDTLYGTLSGSDQPQGFAVTWNCDNFDEEAEAYAFTAAFDGPAYALGANVEMPHVTVTFEKSELVPKDAVDITVTKLEALPKTEFIMVEKPETAEDAKKAMGLRDTINATVKGSRETIALDIVWSCQGYDNEKMSEFTFSADFADTDKYNIDYDDDKVELPEVTLYVISSDEFKLAVNEDDTLTITEWLKPSDSLDIPEDIEDIPVTAIGEKAFQKKTDQPEIKTITFYDTLRSVGKDAFEGVTPEEGVTFYITGKTTLTGADSYKTTVNGKATDEVHFQLPVTDIEVQENGNLTLNTFFVIEAEHGFSVEEDGYAMIPANYGIINHGSIDNYGTLINNGNIYSCDKDANSLDDVTITGNKPVTKHVAEEDGICKHCGALRLTFKLSETSKASLTKMYDGTNVAELEDEDLVPTNAAEDAGVELTAGFVKEDVSEKPAEATAEAETSKDSEIIDAAYYYKTADVGKDIQIIANNPEIEYDEEKYNYFVDELSLEIYGEIIPFDIEHEDNDVGAITVDVEDQTYTGKEIKPKVKVTFDSVNLENEMTLEEGKDYTLTFENNKKVGTAKAVITGMGNFTGVYKEEFEIEEKDSSSSGGSGSSGSGDDDDDDEEAEEEEEDDTGVLMIDEENYGRVLFGRDNLPRPFDQSDEEIETGSAPADPENPPKRLIIEPNAMVDAIGQPIYLDEEQSREKFETVHLRLTNEQIANLQKQGFVELVYELEYARLRVPLNILTSAIKLNAQQAEDEEPTDDAVTSIDMYDFCIEQVNGTQLDERETRAMEGLFPVYPMYRIDVNAVAGEYPKPEKKTADEDVLSEGQEPEAEEVPQQFDTLIAPKQDFVLERLGYVSDIGASAAAEVGADAMPAGCTSQITFSAVPLNENAGAMTEDQVIKTGSIGGGVIEIYTSIHEAADRDNALAVYDGTLFSDYHTRVGSCVVRLSCRLNDAERTILEKEIIQALTAASPKEIDSGFSEKLPKLYPILNVFNAEYVTDETEPAAFEKAQETEYWQPSGAQLELINEDVVDLPEDARQIFVPGDVSDAEAAMRTLHYIEGMYDDYASLHPMGSGLYGVVTATSGDEEEEEEDEAWDEEEVEDEEEEAEEFGAEESEEVTQAFVPAPGEDSEAKYAYIRSGSDGDMYWLIDIANHIVEYYREDNGAYLIGDFTGSLKNGMTVQYRDSGSKVEIRLRYPQTYKFATTMSSGKEILMEQRDVASVESVMAGVR